MIWNPQHADDEFHEIQAAGQTVGLQVRSVEVATPAQLDGALQAATSWGCDSLMTVSSRAIVRARQPIIAFAGRHRLPLAGGWGLWADDGALLSYGPDPNVVVRRASFVTRGGAHGVHRHVALGRPGT